MLPDIPAPPNGGPAPRCPNIPFPPYRYIPGVQPHPIKSDKGHQHEYPPVTLASDVKEFENHPAWLRGLDLFDHRFYWESHEQLEAVWHALSIDSPHRDLVQGIILGAAYRLKWHMGQFQPAKQLLLTAQTRLKRASSSLGSRVWGVDIDALLVDLERIESEGHWPTIQAP